MGVHRPDLCLPDHVVRRGGAAHCREPPERGRAPVGPAGVAESMAEPAGCETTLGGLASTAGLFTDPRESTQGVLCHRGARDRRESTRARQAGQWPGVPAVRFDPVPGLWGQA